MYLRLEGKNVNGKEHAGTHFVFITLLTIQVQSHYIKIKIHYKSSCFTLSVWSLDAGGRNEKCRAFLQERNQNAEKS